MNIELTIEELNTLPATEIASRAEQLATQQ
jgi:hypothetical protein